MATVTKRTPDLLFNDEWGIEFKIVRPFGNNGKEAENWSVNILHPYPGNTSLIGDSIKLKSLHHIRRKAVFVIGYEHDPAKISLSPLFDAYECLSSRVMGISLGPRVEETRTGLIHPEHQVQRCVSWEVI